MREKKMQESDQVGPCMGRQSASEVLRSQAKAMHAKAVELDRLADFLQHVPSDIEQTLWAIFIRHA